MNMNSVGYCGHLTSEESSFANPKTIIELSPRMIREVVTYVVAYMSSNILLEPLI
jgi:hypothetical protein